MLDDLDARGIGLVDAQEVVGRALAREHPVVDRVEPLADRRAELVQVRRPRCSASAASPASATPRRRRGSARTPRGLRGCRTDRSSCRAARSSGTRGTGRAPSTRPDRGSRRARRTARASARSGCGCAPRRSRTGRARRRAPRRATSSFIRVTWFAAPGQQELAARPRAPSTFQCVRSTKPDSHRVEHREVEVVLERRAGARRRTSRCRRSRRAGCAVTCSTCGRSVVAFVRARARAPRTRRASGSCDALARVARAEERVARVDDRRAPRPTLALPVAERDAAAVVHERGVLDEVAQPDASARAGRSRPPRRSRGRTSPRRAGRRGRARRASRTCRSPTPVITSGSSRSECSRTNAAHSSMRGFALSSANASITESRQRADRSVARERRDRRDIGERRRGREAVEPALGDRGVGVEDHDVAGARAAARGSRCATKPRFSALCSTVTGKRRRASRANSST